MTDLVRDHDWGSTALGPRSTWPDALEFAVGLCLDSQFPMMVAWGPDLVQIYNDAFRPILGELKHPSALGASVSDTWSEIWAEIGPSFDQVMVQAMPVWHVDQHLVIDRNGYPEDTYFTYCYSPVRGVEEVDGVLVVCTETTTHVVSQRRLRALSTLNRELLEGADVPDVTSRSVGSLVALPELEAVECHVRLGGELVEVAYGDAPIADEDEIAAALADLSGPTLVELPPRPEDGAVRLLSSAESGEVATVVAFAVDPTHACDPSCREFLAALGQSIATGVGDAHRREVELGRHRELSEALQAAMLLPAADLATVAARYLPASEHRAVGGDWYDVIDLGDGRRGLVVGDCVGHGLEAVSAMGSLRSACRALLLDGRSPAEVLTTLDRFAPTVEGGAHATAVCMVVDVPGCVATYAAAGHPPPVLVQAAGSRTLEGGRGVPLAALPDVRREDDRVTLAAGDVLVLYTDGLVEHPGRPLDAGIARVLERATAHRLDPVAFIADRLIEDLDRASLRDDVAVVVKRVPAEA
jgi:hypothetical protein